MSFKPFWSLLLAKDVGTAQKGKRDLNSILGWESGFDTVKPVELLKKILGHFSNDIVVLDYFAGSGTTGQAVLELNKEDSGNRKFILCTNNESNISEGIAYPRLRTVITGKRKNGTEYGNSMPSNLKYFRTCLVPRHNDYLKEELLLKVKEMIELQNHINVDFDRNIIIISYKDVITYIDNNKDIDKIENIWIRDDILLNGKQQLKISNINIFKIPRNYFDLELKEGGIYD